MRIFYLILLFVLAASQAYGLSYLGEDGNVISNRTLFNDGLGSYALRNRIMNDPQGAVLTSDLDGDGIVEVIARDGLNINIYQNHSLDLAGSFALSCNAGYPVSNMFIHDVDGDAYQEVVVACYQKIYFLNLVNGSFTNVSVLSTAGLTYQDGELLVGCGDTQKCLLAWSQKMGQGIVNTMFLAGFNMTTVGGEATTRTSGGTQLTWCFPHQAQMLYKNHDPGSDSDSSFIYSAIEAEVGDNADFLVFYMGVSENLTLSQELAIEDDMGFGIGGAGQGCRDQLFGNKLTSPLVEDLYPTTGLETVYAYQLSDDTYRMFMVRSDGVLIDQYPQVFVADGEILSSPFLADVFPDTGVNDFCVMGFDRTAQELDALCASELTGYVSILGISYDNIEFKYDMSGLFNISLGYNNMSIGTYSVQASNELTDGADLTEIITSYGTFAFDWTDVYAIQVGPSILTLRPLFVMPVERAAVMMDDFDNLGLTDIVAMNDRNIYYIDDKYSDEEGYVSGYTVTCPDNVWAVNTTIPVTVTVKDDISLVSARAIMYYGESYAQDSGWQANATSGSIFPFNFVVNQTKVSGTLRLMAQDDRLPDSPDIVDLTFTVGVNGIQGDDCIFTVSGLEDVPDEAEDGTNATTDPSSSNALDDVVEDTAANTGLGTTIIWLFFMATMAFVLLLGSAQTDQIPGHVVLVVIILVEAIMFVIGVKMGYIGFGVLITLVVICLTALGLWLAGKFNMIGGSGAPPR